MKWLTGIWDIVASLSVRAKTVFCFAVLIIVGGYFFFDRYLTFQRNIALAQPQMEKREIVKTESNIPDYILYKSKTLFENKAKETK